MPEPGSRIYRIFLLVNVLKFRAIEQSDQIDWHNQGFRIILLKTSVTISKYFKRKKMQLI
jgi:hypothetical protein